MRDNAAAAAYQVGHLFVLLVAGIITWKTDGSGDHAAHLLEREVRTGDAEEFLVLPNYRHSQAQHACITRAFVEVGLGEERPRFFGP
jgi:hypothetical protein